MVKYGNFLKLDVYVFCQLNINTLLSKINRLREIRNYLKLAILGHSLKSEVFHWGFFQLMPLNTQKNEDLVTFAEKILNGKLYFCALGIAKSKLDSSLSNAEVNITGYSIIRAYRNRNSEGLLCY